MGFRADDLEGMVCALFGLVFPVKPIAFPDATIPYEVRRGVEIYAQGKGLERLYLDDRSVIGTWFDGMRKRDADHAIWVSPSLVSRWLGYLEAKEKWPDGEREARWRRLRNELGGKLTFIVRICSLPRIDFLEQEAVTRGSENSVREVRFLWTCSLPEWPSVREKEGYLGWSRGRGPWPEAAPAAGFRVEPGVERVRVLQARRPEAVLADDWWRRVPFGESLRSEFDSGDDSWQIPLGDYHSATYLVQIPVPDRPFPDAQFELRAFRREKEQIARFSIFTGRSRRR